MNTQNPLLVSLDRSRTRGTFQTMHPRCEARSTVARVCQRKPWHHNSFLRLLFAVVAALSLPSGLQSAEFLEATMQLESNWRSVTPYKTNESHQIIPARCIFGPADNWLVEGDFLLNARKTWWRFEDKIAARTVVTKELPESAFQNNSAVSARVGHAPPIGQHTFRKYDSADGRPVGVGSENIVWLAFCSGSYLKQPGRDIPPLTGPTPFEYKDKTLAYDDNLGLPKTVELYSSDGQLITKYEVLASTNVSGWNIPLAFKLVQNKHPNGSPASVGFELLGHVTSLTRVPRIELPPELRDPLSQPAK